MSRFNLQTDNRIINYAGGEAHQESPELELVSLLLTSFVQDQFYRSSGETLARLRSLAKLCDPLFAAKAAIYARNTFGMRSVTHAMASELAPLISGKTWAKDFYKAIIHRPDDMLEIVSYFKAYCGKTIPAAMKKGLALAFDNFDNYQIAKYRAEGKNIKMVDLVNLLHPTPTEKNSESLRLLMKNKLSASETWEAMLTKAGQNGKNAVETEEQKRQAWKSLIENYKIGYFALLRNLRNILETAINYTPAENRDEITLQIKKLEKKIRKQKYVFEHRQENMRAVINREHKKWCGLSAIYQRINWKKMTLQNSPFLILWDRNDTLDLLDRKLESIQQSMKKQNIKLNTLTNKLYQNYPQPIELYKEKLIRSGQLTDADLLDKTCEMLTNEKLIRKSMVLPFRFVTAQKEIENIYLKGKENIVQALHTALEISCDNVPKLEGKTLVVSDFSGSMGEGITSYKGQASLLGAILAKHNQADFMIFGDTAAYVSVNLSDSAMQITNYLLSQNRESKKTVQVGHGTNFHSIFETANKRYDRIIILSDMQGWIGGNTPENSFKKYKKYFGGNPFIYSIDLAGLGTLQFPENKIFCMAGFSDKILDVMKALETDNQALFNAINAVSF
jgi:hypothetical protein